MEYFKIKKEHDGVRILTESTMIMLNSNELFTRKEMERYGIPFEYAERIEESKSKITFWKQGWKQHACRYLKADFDPSIGKWGC